MGTEFVLHNKDCVAGMKGLASGSVDVVVTSPPYNLGIEYRSYDDRGPREPFLAWCVEWAREVKRLLADDGSFFLNLGASPRNPLLPHQLLLALATEDLFRLQNTFHWIKSITVETVDGESVSAGHFKPINSKRFVNDCHEYVFHLTKEGTVPLDRRSAGVPYVHKSNIARWKHTGGADLRCRGNTWFIPYETINSRIRERPHPASFPPALVAQCLKLHGRGGETVLMDPFLGIGSSAVAARQMCVKTFIGFEIDSHYLEVARERLAEAGRPADLQGEFPL